MGVSLKTRGTEAPGRAVGARAFVELPDVTVRDEALAAVMLVLVFALVLVAARVAAKFAVMFGSMATRSITRTTPGKVCSVATSRCFVTGEGTLPPTVTMPLVALKVTGAQVGMVPASRWIMFERKRLIRAQSDSVNAESSAAPFVAVIVLLDHAPAP